MQYRILGCIGLYISEVGYGGGRITRQQEQARLIHMLHHAFELGFNYVDTYGNGLSETVIGKAVEKRRDKCIITAKTEAFDPKSIVEDEDGSLNGWTST